jgi:hypothetical protein
VIQSDGAILIVHRHHLLSVTLDGAVRWTQSFDEPAAPPVALTEGRAFIVFAKKVCVFDERGVLLVQIDGPTEYPGFYSFQRADAPNLSPDGRVFLPQNGCYDFLALDGTKLTEFEAVSQDDPEQPAFYSDGSMALCYADKTGNYFGRVTPANEVVWLTDFCGNTPPTISSLQYAAVADRFNPGAGSALISPEGRIVGRYAEPARFAELGADWIALSATSVARITSDGRVQWKHPLRIDPDLNTHWFLNQPIVDVEGFVYLSDAQQVSCYDQEGRPVFTFPLTGFQPTSLSPVAPGLIACEDEDQLVIFGNA